jgi:hypothetical protein
MIHTDICFKIVLQKFGKFASELKFKKRLPILNISHQSSVNNTPHLLFPALITHAGPKSGQPATNTSFNCTAFTSIIAVLGFVLMGTFAHVSLSSGFLNFAETPMPFVENGEGILVCLDEGISINSGGKLMIIK